jgi:hypothetical protein
MNQVINLVIVSETSPSAIAKERCPIRVKLMPLPGNTRLYSIYDRWWVQAHLAKINLEDSFEHYSLLKTAKDNVEIISIGFDEGSDDIDDISDLVKRLSMFKKQEPMIWVCDWFDQHPNAKVLKQKLEETGLIICIMENDLNDTIRKNKFK